MRVGRRSSGEMDGSRPGRWCLQALLQPLGQLLVLPRRCTKLLVVRRQPCTVAGMSTPPSLSIRDRVSDEPVSLSVLVVRRVAELEREASPRPDEVSSASDHYVLRATGVPEVSIETAEAVA